MPWWWANPGYPSPAGGAGTDDELSGRPIPTRASAITRAPKKVVASLIVALLAALTGACSADFTTTKHTQSAPKQSQAAPSAAGPGFLAPGSDPSVLPGNVLIADKANNRLVQVTPAGQVAWSFPGPNDLAPGENFRVPDDAFFSPDGRSIVTTEEDDYVISLIDPAAHRITYRYGTPGTPGSKPNQLYNPDDAQLAPDGRIFSADIKNCRLVVIRPPARQLDEQIGGHCGHNPPQGFASPNGAFPMSNGNTVVTEINGDWIDVLDRSGRLVTQTHAPGFSYPSDTNEVRPGLFLSVDYVKPGAIEVFDQQGRVVWRYAPTGADALNKPSLAMGLPNGDVLVNDDYNDRVIVVDPRTNRIVWQYGHTGQPGTAPGYLNIPDGVDEAPPNSLVMRFRGVMAIPGGMRPSGAETGHGNAGE